MTVYVVMARNERDQDSEAWVNAAFSTEEKARQFIERNLGVTNVLGRKYDRWVETAELDEFDKPEGD